MLRWHDSCPRQCGMILAKAIYANNITMLTRYGLIYMYCYTVISYVNDIAWLRFLAQGDFKLLSNITRLWSGLPWQGKRLPSYVLYDPSILTPRRSIAHLFCQ